MWSSWTEKATKGFSEALEKTGEAITHATNKAKETAANVIEPTANPGTDPSSSTGPASSTSSPSSEGAAATATKTTSSTATDGTTVGLNLSNFGANVKNVVSAATTAVAATASAATGSTSTPSTGTGTGAPSPVGSNNNNKLLNNIQAGWSNVVETTKRSIDATKEVVEKEQSRIERNFPLIRGNRGGKRDPKLPLDVDALRDAEVVYVTDRIITMSHPAMASSVDPNITAERKLAAVGHLLQRRHDGRFLVWNLSEVEYNVAILDDQVLTFSFPGSPSPPLGLMLKLLISMENWMRADERNVAVVHCLTGRGRTSTVLAAFLCWMGEAGFHDINQAVAYIASCKQLTTEELTIPSQRRYASYFKNMLDGVRPSQPPLMLKRIIMSEAPRYAKGPARQKPASSGNTAGGEETKQQDGGAGTDSSKPNQTDSTVPEEKLMGCAPYLQIFKGGQLVFTTAATLHYQQDEEELPFVQGIDGTIPFNIDQIIQGDILIRCRHLTFNKQRVSMFRSAFHTGYVPPNVMRLSKSQLDGACSDKRFPNDFFLDLIFEKVDVETATKLLEDQEEEATASKELEEQNDRIDITANKKPVVKATSYDSMLAGDSRFWDVIAQRRKEQIEQKKKDDPMFGPTVGRRRGGDKLNKKKKKSADGSGESGGGDSKGKSGGGNDSSKPLTQLETFSIGNELDFLPSESIPTPKVSETAGTTAKEPERDDLMDALNALDEDAGDLGTEEIVFDHGSDAVASSHQPSGQSATTSEPPTSGESVPSRQVEGENLVGDSVPAGPSTTTADKEVTTASATTEVPGPDVTTITTSGNTAPTDSSAAAAAAAAATVDETDGMEDIDALLASANDDLGDIDLAAFDDDDDLEDLENLLKT